MADVKGEFHDPEADRSLFEVLRVYHDDEVERMEMETGVIDEACAGAMAATLEE